MSILLIIETSYLEIYVSICYIDAHQILGQCDLYFRNDSIFDFLTFLSIISEVI